ncbi:DUF1707 domain-containing protein [Asanoa sp. NPDC050611]|uniref:DUF1707 SHOCT-like domain-containing protein n=1 Tax=Asanoa sp. NPDC050611 TaxID=3157098 RepID=UPI003410ADF4
MDEPRDEADRVRVSDREREQVVDLLGRAAAEGRLTLDEYADRAADAHAAQTRGELARLTDDLPAVLPSAAPLPRPTAAPDQAPVRMVAVFGNESRKGHWLVPARLQTWSVFGDCHLELQEAQLQSPLTTLEVNVVFGSATIFVPEGVEVRLTGPAVFGSKESKLHGAPRPGGPVLDVRVKVVFGSVTVRPPRRR